MEDLTVVVEDENNDDEGENDDEERFGARLTASCHLARLNSL